MRGSPIHDPPQTGRDAAAPHTRARAIAEHGGKERYTSTTGPAIVASKPKPMHTAVQILSPTSTTLVTRSRSRIFIVEAQTLTALMKHDTRAAAVIKTALTPRERTRVGSPTRPARAHLGVVEEVDGLELALRAIAEGVYQVRLVGSQPAGGFPHDLHIPFCDKVLRNSSPAERARLS